MNVIANKTTTVDAQKTVGEIQSLLAKSGAKQLLVEFDAGDPVSISFKIEVDGNPINFKLPCNWLGVMRALKGQVPRRLLNHEHAKRVGWRIIRDWLRAQLSLIAAGASTLEEVMLPWAITNTGNTVSKELLLGRSSKLIGLPGPTEQSDG